MSGEEMRLRAAELRQKAEVAESETGKSALLAASETWDLLAKASQKRSEEIFLPLLTEQGRPKP